MKVSLLKNCFLLRGEAKVSLIASLITDGGTDDEEEEGRCQNKTVTQHLPESLSLLASLSSHNNMTSLQLAQKARELTLNNKPARLYKCIIR